MSPEPAATRPIRTLLVANRGEIAARIVRTARDLGIRTVAVYADPDAAAPYVGQADVAVPIGGSSAATSYLDVTKIIDAARVGAADAVHPGYGFLSENADAAQAVIDAGLAWVGPAPAAIRAMALKVAAKEAAASAGVPLLPGATLNGDDEATWAASAREVGYPLLVKASAGGGGRGMRRVADPAGLYEAVRAARREAAGAFGDPTVFVERYVAAGRHVEVQVAGDAYGTVLHVGERECSVQRRHQKVVEEAPAPGLGEAVRARLHAAAVALARAIGYTSLGTVEFLVDGFGEDAAFAFLEMNTRLQVEHPVTEQVYGVDLVAWQLAVAAGRPLPVTQTDLVPTGHAIEARWYAEDPARDFAPSTGRLAVLDWPVDAPGLRVDAGVAAGSVVSPYYDALLAKVIATGPDRDTARARLVRALRGTRAHGLATNRDSLVAILDSAAFRAGRATTALLVDEPGLLAPVLDAGTRRVLAATAAVASAAANRAGSPVPFARPGFRSLGAAPRMHLDLVDAVGTVPVDYRFTRGGDLDATIGGQPLHAAVLAAGPDRVDLVVAGLRRRCTVTIDGDLVGVDDGWDSATFTVARRFPEHAGEADAGGAVTPVPGTVTRVAVAAGDRVSAGATLVLLEAMKMEHRIVAGADGVVAAVHVVAGQPVDAHTLVVTITPDEPA